MKGILGKDMKFLPHRAQQKSWMMLLMFQVSRPSGTETVNKFDLMVHHQNCAINPWCESCDVFFLLAGNMMDKMKATQSSVTEATFHTLSTFIHYIIHIKVNHQAAPPGAPQAWVTFTFNNRNPGVMVNGFFLCPIFVLFYHMECGAAFLPQINQKRVLVHCYKTNMKVSCNIL